MCPPLETFKNARLQMIAKMLRDYYCRTQMVNPPLDGSKFREYNVWIPDVYLEADS